METRRTERTVNGRIRTDIQYKVQCEMCSADRWVYSWDLDQKICGQCQRVLAGEASFRLEVQRIGYRAAIELRAKRMRDEMPSEPERQLMSLLDELGVEYKRQEIVWFTKPDTGDPGAFIIDFLISGKLLINVDGYWHRFSERKKKRDALLAALFPEVVHITDIELADPDAVRARLATDLFGSTQERMW